MTQTTSGAPSTLSHRLVLITGGSSGVGLEVARQACAVGADVLVVGSDAAKLECAAAELPSDQIAVFAGDVKDSATAESAFAHARQIFNKPVSVLVNSAGTILRKIAAETLNHEWSNVMQVNINGVFYFCRAFAQQAATIDGAIVNVSSTCGQVGSAGLAAYCTSKGAVDQLTRTLALELGDRKITVNAVAPGAINSPMLYSNHAEQVSDDSIRQRNIDSIPIGAVAQAEEVARAILFIATQRHITGTILPIDGGYTAQ